ncbi:hypothetical protein [Rhodococcus tukisamuensis]|uniref:Secreted protein n=1 Tax=Rhodococcus tukisamuensis TaxID=168276 RepID=A0A1G6US85_9NOCA|nr:hypothetical protein [Rhodococcus tukisamuensis]SDD43415.1 hypothetical protein SAMN05444580_104263 [Rhodococcus tukisamuensis]
MRKTRVRRSITGTVAAAAVLALPLGSSAAAAANPPQVPATTTVFQVPATFVSACSTVGFQCWVPYRLATVTPSAITGAPGVVTFTAGPPATRSTLDCIDVSVNWLNVTTGAAGTTVLSAVTPVDYSRPVPPEDWCRYTPATVATGSGTIAATADVNASARIVPLWSGVWPQVPVGPGFGVFQVP